MFTKLLAMYGWGKLRLPKKKRTLTNFAQTIASPTTINKGSAWREMKCEVIKFFVCTPNVFLF